MPARTDIKKILVVGSGPIIIGQACEFDYSGTQAIRALKEEGYEVILINSNPATIMTDPDLADKVFLEPINARYLERIISEEKPDAILPTMGGQTALNVTLDVHKNGVLEKYGVEVIGAKPEAIFRAEDRDSFKKTMNSIGVKSARSVVARSKNDVNKVLKEIGLPLILRPSFTLGGQGGGQAKTKEEFLEKLEKALFLSPTGDVLIEESLVGWKEFELEVVRDKADNVVIVCSIENFDPMGVHTGDSITVAPAQTLTDREYQHLRNLSIKIIRAIGVETGGSNIQFAVNPKDGRVICIEMNPRVSRSSALASKATGFPIARVAAKLAIGFTLDELVNDITKSTPCSFEPSIDYVVTKIPRFDFDKFRPTPPSLTTQMKSVGETMAIGRTFQESLGKAVAGLETNVNWLAPIRGGDKPNWPLIENPQPLRLRAIADALRYKTSSNEISRRSGVTRWFIDRLAELLSYEASLKNWPPTDSILMQAKQAGWSDCAIAETAQIEPKLSEKNVREYRESKSIFSSFHMVDTCAAEFEAKTPYLYSSYFGKDESVISKNKKIMILGGGPNRIGQGIEFDYCCVHAAMALRAEGVETIMINCNPETVSTDFDISDKLYFEPLTPEHVLNIAKLEKPSGIIVQFGGQTPLKIAKKLEEGGLKVLGTSTESIDTAEDRELFDKLVKGLETIGLKQPPSALASTAEEAIEKAKQLGFPVLLRPSYVLGGRGMRVIYDLEHFKKWINEAIYLSDHHPVLIDRFLDRATEVDVDAICDGEQVFIGGILEHIEEAGIHSGDSSCVIPSITLSKDVCSRIRVYTRELGKKLKVIGLMNVQYAIQNESVYLLEVNPRASRTVPFVSKAVHRPLAKIAVQIMLGKKFSDLGITEDLDLKLETYNVKAPVFPFDKFPNVDVLLGPEMKSTGEVMGRCKDFAGAYAKALDAAGMRLPISGNVFLSVRDEDKIEVLEIAKGLKESGFNLFATKGTATFLEKHHLKTEVIKKVLEGSPHCVDAIKERKFAFIINTTSDHQAIIDSFSLRRAALESKIPYSTIMSSARAMYSAILAEKQGPIDILPL